ncbi:MAG: diaminopropionate ammonia-lyase [Bacteroidota bacterium]|nr:MAG: diaminopropionate ammonia-lyase [Bacteroidota bacterium]
MSATGYLINQRSAYQPVFTEDTTPVLNDFESAYHYHQTLADYKPTPLIELPTLAKKCGIGKLLLKDEGQRFGTGALKILGASYAVHHFTQSEPVIGICTATDGNHGRAVAWAAKHKGYKSVVFVPHFTKPGRIKAIEREGGKVIVSAGDYDTAVKEAAYFAREKNFKLIQDTAWKEYLDVPATITSGYYTEMQELLNQTNRFSKPHIDVVFLQAGVGSWPSAVVHFFRKYLNNQSVKIVCVEPFESDCIYESIKSKSLATTRKSQKTIMAGLNCGTPSLLAFEILQQGADAFMLISDHFTIDAIKYLNAPMPGDPYVASGESGASGLGALLALMQEKSLLDLKRFLQINENSNILIFNTENVTDAESISSVIQA